jgi:hypothetical protein
MGGADGFGPQILNWFPKVSFETYFVLICLGKGFGHLE